jgi:hypothetical protein
VTTCCFIPRSACGGAANATARTARVGDTVGSRVEVKGRLGVSYATRSGPPRTIQGAIRMRWECRYSSCEMLYLEVGSEYVRCYLDHSPAGADLWTFAEVLAGEHDGYVRDLFGEAALAELKATVRQRVRGG